jgi:hypothetical protein
MRTRHVLFVLALAALPAAALDHADPIALNAAAIEAIRADDLRTAEILLARASRLAPNDSRLAKTRQALQAKRAGENVVLEAPAAPAAAVEAQPSSATVLREPPPLWPAKK